MDRDMADLNADELNTNAELGSNEQQPEPEMRRFEDLSLAELIGQLLRRPTNTLGGLQETLRSNGDAQYIEESFDVDSAEDGTQGLRSPVRVVPVRRLTIELDSLRPLALLGGLLLIALVGSFILTTAKRDYSNITLIIGGSLMLLSTVGFAYITSTEYHTQRLPALKNDEDSL